MISEKSRNYKIDFLKGVAIFLVVWGHCIQHLNNGEIDFFSDPFFIIIYSFHMPLFMMICGWVFFYSFPRKNLKEIIISKSKQLVVPVISWSVTFAFINGLIINKFHFIKAICQISIVHMYFAFWFITVLYVITIIFSVISKSTSKYSVGLLCLFGFVILFLPDAYLLERIKFMYPYFLLGFFANKYRIYLYKMKSSIGIISLVIWVCMLVFWKNDYYIYKTHMSFYHVNLLDKIFIVSYRYCAGLAGIGSIFFGVSLLPKGFFRSRFVFRIIQSGINSLGIYIITSILFIYILSKIVFSEVLIDNRIIYDLIFTLLFTIMLTIICNIVIYFINKNKFLKLFYLGGR
jgi:fucose 4-O-acetylase-like acetyltransferase